MSRFLAIDWDSNEVRFVLAQVGKNSVRVEKTGSASYSVVECKDVSSPEDSSKPDEDDEIDHTQSPTGNDDNALKDAGRPDTRESFAEKVGRTLRTLLKEEQIPSAKLLVAASRSNVEVLQLEFPKADEQDYPDLVRNRVLMESSTYLEGQPLDYLPLVGDGPTRRIMSVSTSRAQLNDIRSMVSPRRPARIELRAAALAEFFRDTQHNDVSQQETDEAEPVDSFPVLLIQEVCDEVNLVVCRKGEIVYLRTFRVPPELVGAERNTRLVAEIVRTLAVAVDHPESAPIEQVYYFDQEEVAEISDVSPASFEPGESTNHGDVSDKGSPFDCGDEIRAQLASQGISLIRFNPFASVTGNVSVDRPGRFAPLLGMLLAEQEQRKPLIDLVHPRKKPTPPNYLLYLIALVFLALSLAGYAWHWNREELARLKSDLAKLENQRDQVAVFIRNEQPLYQVLNMAIQWDTAYGVVVLDELRDITLRVPKAPELIVTRLAYSGNVRGRPAFILGGKVVSAAVYQRFYQSLTSDGSHTIQTAGPKKLTDGGGFTHEFSAQIFCTRRPFTAYWQSLPQALQQISNQKPEFYDFQMSSAANRSSSPKQLSPTGSGIPPKSPNTPISTPVKPQRKTK